MGEGAKDDKWEVPNLQWLAADKSLKEEQSLYRCISKVVSHLHMVLNIQHFK